MSITTIDTKILPRIMFALKMSIMDMSLNIKLVGREFVRGIRKHTPHSTYHLYRTCKIISVKATPFTGKVSVGWERKDFKRKKFYAVFVGEGTGIHGKSHKLIVSKKKAKIPMMRYQYNGNWVSMKSVKGMKPRKMLEKGYKSSVSGATSLLLRTFYTSMRVRKHA